MVDTAGRGVRRERLLHGGKGRTCGHVPCGIALVAPRAVPTPRATPMRIGPTPPHALAVARGHGPHTPRRESARATQHMAMSTHRGVCHACVKHARPWARPHLSSEVHAMRHDWRGGAWRMPRATTARRQGRAGRWGNGGGGTAAGSEAVAPRPFAQPRVRPCRMWGCIAHGSDPRGADVVATPMCIDTTPSQAPVAVAGRATCAPRRASAGDTPRAATVGHQGVGHARVRRARPWLRPAPAIQGAGLAT